LSEALQNIPISTTFLFLLAGLISLLTSMTNRLLTDPEKSKAWRREIAEWNKELQEARREGDKKKMEKVMKKQKQIMQLQSKMMWQSIKVTAIFFVPLLIIWSVLGGFYVKDMKPIPVAFLPGVGATLPLPIFNISLLWWYFICSMLFGTVFSHLLGITEVSE
jgi:uncharacterized membrane protein (DUF106 family)